MPSVVLIVHNVRSCYNVGALLRTAEGLGVEAVYLTGYTPYPSSPDDSRLPHLARKIDAQIHKTALGAERMIDWRHEEDIYKVITGVKAVDFKLAALEQAEGSITLSDFQPPDRLALIVGRE